MLVSGCFESFGGQDCLGLVSMANCQDFVDQMFDDLNVNFGHEKRITAAS